MRNAISGLASSFVVGAMALTRLASAAPPPPANDNWANATVISSLPFSTTSPGPAPDLTSATTEATDPDPPPCLGVFETASRTVWYKYTTGASAEYLTLQSQVALGDSSKALVLIAVYTSTGSPGAFNVVSGGCNDASYVAASNAYRTRLAGLRLAPATTYSIEIAVVTTGASGNALSFSVDAAQQYHVTTTADADNGSCGATCSLRDAISASNADPGAVIIPAGTYKLSIPGAYDKDNHTGDLDATQGMGIYGAGMNATVITADPALDPAFDDRILMLDPKQAAGMAFSVGDLTLTNGKAPPVPFGSFLGYENSGGGLCVAGGANSGDDFVGLERIAVTSNSAPGGGGIEFLAPGTIRDSWIAGNSTNGAGYGGGLDVASGSRHLSISGTTISGNTMSPPFGTPAGGGGGMFAFGSVSLVNSTVSNNSSNNYGGGVWFDGDASIASSTIAYNEAFHGNPYKTDVGGGIYFDTGAISVVDSIIAYNFGGDPNAGGSPDPMYEDDCATFGGTLTASYNIVQGPDNCPFTAGDTHIDPKVLPTLADRGGPTPTLTIDPSGPAHDSGDPTGCKDPDGLPLAWDQRGPGFPRADDGTHCDKGAFEWVDLVFKNGFD